MERTRDVRSEATKKIREDKMMKKYNKFVKGLIPTIPSADVEEIVKDRVPNSIKMILGDLKIDHGLMKWLPEANVVATVTNIVIDGVNEPVARLVHSMPFHFKAFSDIAERRQNTASESPSIAEELRKLKPPAEGEAEYQTFVDQLQNLMTNIIRRVAFVINSNELVSGGMLTSAIMSRISIPIATKRKICKHLFNQISTFAGESIYTFFISDEKLVRDTIITYLT